MLNAKFSADIPLPQVGSIGYRRGTGQRARVLQRNEPPLFQSERTCLVQLFDWIPATRSHRGFWTPVPGSSGNTTVGEADLFPTEDEAQHAGRRRARRSRRVA